MQKASQIPPRNKTWKERIMGGLGFTPKPDEEAEHVKAHVEDAHKINRKDREQFDKRLRLQRQHSDEELEERRKRYLEHRGEEPTFHLRGPLNKPPRPSEGPCEVKQGPVVHPMEDETIPRTPRIPPAPMPTTIAQSLHIRQRTTQKRANHGLTLQSRWRKG